MKLLATLLCKLVLTSREKCRPVTLYSSHIIFISVVLSIKKHTVQFTVTQLHHNVIDTYRSSSKTNTFLRSTKVSLSDFGINYIRQCKHRPLISGKCYERFNAFFRLTGLRQVTSLDLVHCLYEVHL